MRTQNQTTQERIRQRKTTDPNASYALPPARLLPAAAEPWVFEPWVFEPWNHPWNRTQGLEPFNRNPSNHVRTPPHLSVRSPGYSSRYAALVRIPCRNSGRGLRRSPILGRDAALTGWKHNNNKIRTKALPLRITVSIPRQLTYVQSVAQSDALVVGDAASGTMGERAVVERMMLVALERAQRATLERRLPAGVRKAHSVRHHARGDVRASPRIRRGRATGRERCAALLGR